MRSSRCTASTTALQGNTGERPEPRARSAGTPDAGPEEQPRSEGGETGRLQDALYGTRWAACTLTQQPPGGVWQRWRHFRLSQPGGGGGGRTCYGHLVGAARHPTIHGTACHNNHPAQNVPMARRGHPVPWEGGSPSGKAQADARQKISGLSPGRAFLALRLWLTTCQPLSGSHHTHENGDDHSSHPEGCCDGQVDVNTRRRRGGTGHGGRSARSAAAGGLSARPRRRGHVSPAFGDGAPSAKFGSATGVWETGVPERLHRESPGSC